MIDNTRIFLPVSILICLVWLSLMAYETKKRQEIDLPELVLNHDFDIPRKKISFQHLHPAIEALSNPFAEKIFQSVHLTGFIRNDDGAWKCILLGNNNKYIVLKPGETKEGMTLLKTDGKTCLIKFGSFMKELKIHK
ncbi:MAG: hypothetical protein HQM10_21110 [Candidatus Riflebacteria bacterium]|nr:hypothetical protein [Candidatus Riflebacteria bacterium]